MKTLVATEFLKLRTIRSPWLLLIAAQLIVVAGIGGLIANKADTHLAATASRALAHAGLVSLLSLVLGVMAVAGEYRHKTITDTYLATPQRGRVILAKLGVYTLVGAAFGVVSVATGLVATAIWFAVRGGTPDLSNTELLRTIGGDIAWNAAFAAIGVGVGALVRNLAGGIATALVWIALMEGLIGQLLGDSGRWLPFASGRALGYTDPGGAGLPQWGAGLVLAGYAALFAVLAVLTTVRRDVT
jgi:ABC-2 type transport system permease protein